MEKVIVGKNISKTYHMGEVEVKALDGIDFEIYSGEFLVVLGPSGSGKSTLINIIGGMDSVSGGEIYYKDRSLHNADEKQLTTYRRDAVGFVFQFYNLMPNLTAYENVKLSTEIATNPFKVDEILKAIELYDRKEHFPSQMSGGQQQRVAIARAIAKNPDILLCDEPTGALDITTGMQVLKTLIKFNKEYKKTVIIITHNASIAGIGNRVFHIKDGKIDKIIHNENPIEPEQVSW